MKIVIMGTPVTSGNRGVLALGCSLAQLFTSNREDIHISLLTGIRQATNFELRGKKGRTRIPVVNYRLSPKSKPSEHLLFIILCSILYRLINSNAFRLFLVRKIPFIRCVSEADIVGDIRGGDSFSDIYGIKRFSLGSLPSICVILIKGSIVHFPQTYGPFKSKAAEHLARFLLNKSSTIIARDTRSLKAAKNILNKTKTIELTPDVAFSLTPITPNNPVLTPSVKNAEQLLKMRAIGINVNGLMYNGGYSRNNMFGLEMQYDSFLHEICTHFLKQTDRDIILVPHTFAPAGDTESDNHACTELKKRIDIKFHDRIRIVSKEYDQYEIKGIIGLCDFFIGSRMHSCIAALSQGVPCVGVAYSMKFQGVFESVGMGDWVIDGRSMKNSESVARTSELYTNRNDSREQLLKNAKNANKKLSDAFSNILSKVS